MRKNIFISLVSLVLILAVTSCENQPWEFDDYDYQTVYFPYQTPVRTLVLGEYIYDNTLDNNHQCKIMATMGGVYENKADRVISFKVENSLCDNLHIETAEGSQVLAMPSSYYKLLDNTITIPSGSFRGGVTVEFTDAFFADPKSVEKTYAIPLVMTGVAGADSILSGVPKLDGGDRRVPGDWDIQTMDYTIYLVNYVNKYHGSYLRRGVDTAKGNGNSLLDTTVTYRAKYVEKDEVAKLTTKSLNSNVLSLSATNVGGEKVSYSVLLTFDDNGTCQVSKADAAASYTVTGSGKYVVDGDSWGNAAKDALLLDYTVDFNSVTHHFVDTMVIRDRGIVMEAFKPFVAQ